MTQPPDPVAALAEALDTPAIFDDELAESEAMDIATALHDALHAAGWSLSHDSEREALVERLRAIAGRWQKAQGYMRRHGFVLDKWPPPGVDRPADHLAELDTETRWQGLAFSLYTDLAEVGSWADALLEGIDDARAAIEGRP